MYGYSLKKVARNLPTPLHQLSSCAGCKMTSSSDSYFSIKITRILMTLVGFWTADSEKEQFVSNIIRFYTVTAIISAIFITGIDFYHTLDDFYVATYNACALMPVMVCLVKITGFTIYRREIMEMIRYTQENFWNGNYDDYGKAILRNTDKKGILLICSFTFFVQGTVVCYIMTPIIENIGRNDSDRILAFKVWLNLPVSESPYYEGFSALLDLTCIHAGLCFCCFDNFLCMLNIHVAAQFKILQRKFSTICDVSDNEKMEKSIDGVPVDMDKYSARCYDKFKNCVERHHALIKFVKDLEHMFTFLVLGQLLVSSVMLCVAGFQLSQGQSTIIRRLIFVAHTIGSIFQLLVVTLTANEVIVESENVAKGAYSTLFYNLPYDGPGQNIRNGLILVIMRAQKACCITAGRFFPVSLETFTKVTTTSMSYFTLLRQMEEEISEVLIYTANE